MEEHQSRVKNYLMSQLQEQMRSTVSKLDISIIDGCFKGLDHYLEAFQMTYTDKYWENLYEALLKNIEYPEEKDGQKKIGRRYYRRSALNLFRRHSYLWTNKLIQDKDSKIVYLSLKKWTESPTSDVSKLLLISCLFKFLQDIKRNLSFKAHIH